MKNLLDTHTVIWLATNAPRLSEAAKQAIFNPAYENFVSIASAWEVSIKISIDKLQLADGVSEFFKIINENGFVLLPLTEDYIRQVDKLPFIHRDPFDRMLIATAKCEEMNLITFDANIQKYDVSWVW